jgi:hypothetical protein
MSAIYTLARHTLRTYLQEKILLVVLVFGGLLMVSSYVLSPLAVGAQIKIVIDIGLASVSIFTVVLMCPGRQLVHLEKERGICVRSSPSRFRAWTSFSGSISAPSRWPASSSC